MFSGGGRGDQKGTLKRKGLIKCIVAKNVMPFCITSKNVEKSRENFRNFSEVLGKE